MQARHTGQGTVFEVLAHTPLLNWNYPTAITYGTALSSRQLDASRLPIPSPRNR